ncbi:hypothetical protein H0H93_007754, partial [Arthromyces matolae]
HAANGYNYEDRQKWVLLSPDLYPAPDFPVSPSIMRSSTLLRCSLALNVPLLVHGDVYPDYPAGNMQTTGQSCQIKWKGDVNSTTVWKGNMKITLRSGSNLAMQDVITVVGGQDGSVDGSFTWPCPDVTPNSAIYFYQFDSPLASMPVWTTRFPIASTSGQVTDPANRKQPDGTEIPWGIGQLANTPTPTRPPTVSATPQNVAPGIPSGCNSFYTDQTGDICANILPPFGLTVDQTTHLVRYALDHFVLQIHDRKYNFLIHEPLGLALQHFLEASNHQGVHPGFVKLLGFYILKGLQFMHSAKVVHTDISATNILMTLLDKSIYKEGEEEELNDPSARKILEDSIIFETRELPGSMRRWVDVKAIPIICDFGEARTGSDLHEGPVQPLPYKAPEVLLHLPWYTALDVWSFGCLMWQLVVGDHLFPREKNPDRPQEADRNHLGLMVALLGLPPRTLLQRSGTRADIFFNEDGSFKGEVPNVTFESTLASSLKGNNKEVMTPDECQLFLALMRRTLTWSQEDRATADELLKDRWISS